MIHPYTKYNLNPSNHHWQNERKLIIKSVTDGRRSGRTTPYHNTSRFQRAYKNWCLLSKVWVSLTAQVSLLFFENQENGLLRAKGVAILDTGGGGI
jgi:hypothetical protein